MSKTKSLDHGLLNPFSGEATEIKEKPDEKGAPSLTEKRKELPEEIITTYIVSDRDTLTSIAARFDTTPSELTKLNRLATPYIFPGQKLYIPPSIKSESTSGATYHVETLHEDLPSEEKELLDNLRPVSPKPGHVERIRTPSIVRGSIEQVEESSPFTARFLKINVRHITDGQGVVSGVLLVTPNAVMFDPNVSDSLVIENGPEAYGVIAPMDFVVNIVIYHDIAHMQIGHTDKFDGEKPNIYHSHSYTKNNSEQETDSLMVKDETFPELATGDDADSVCSSTEREGDAFPKAFERDLITPVHIEPNDKCQTVQEERKKSLLDHYWASPTRDRHLSNEAEGSIDSLTIDQKKKEDTTDNVAEKTCYDSVIITQDPLTSAQPHAVKVEHIDSYTVSKKDWIPPLQSNHTGNSNATSNSINKKMSSVSFNLEGCNVLETEGKKESESGDTRKSKMLKRLSYPLSWMETFSADKEQNRSSQPPHSADAQHNSVFSKVFSRRSSVGTFSKHTETSKPSKQSQPKLDYRSMVSVEDMPELFVSFDKLIPKPARSCDDPPLYLRLRMGKPMDKPISKSTPLMSYGKKRVKPEYWFSIPRNRVDDLYSFIEAWFPHLYGELNEEQVRSRGYELIDHDTELWSQDSTPTVSRHGSQDGGMADYTKENWDILPMSDNVRKTFATTTQPSLDAEIMLPELIGTTEILQEEHRSALQNHLPARAEGYNWALVFSTSQHGFSLNSMYRKMYKLESPILLVIQDTDNNVFGALTSCAFQVSDHFYGTGESLLFTFVPKFQVYNWTGENLYFIKGNNESLSIGTGDGKFGLWLDGDLYLGRSEPCKTYGNEPLTPNIDFVVKTLECWAFI